MNQKLNTYTLVLFFVLWSNNLLWSKATTAHYSTNDNIAVKCDFADLTLNSQAAVDAFSSGPIHEGELIISGDDIVDLSALSTLTEITGRLSIVDNGQLTNLNGLQNLEKLGSILTIGYNSALIDISGLSGLTAVVEQIVVVENNALTHLDGLENIQSSLVNLNIIQNDNLLNINGLIGLIEVVELIQIDDNSVLSNLDGLANISGFCGNILLENNPMLVQIDGLSGITNMERLTLVGAGQLTNLDAFNHLTNYFSNGLIIAGNDALTNLDGLQNILGTNELVIVSNPNLAMCCGVFDLFTIVSPPSATINNNLPNCNSPTEILEFCGVPGCNGPFDITTQADLEALAGCTTIFGNLYISGTGITDLSPLSSLTEVTKTLFLNELTISSLAGLENLSALGGGLTIVECNALTDLQGLNNLTNIDGSLSIVQNDLLESMAGIDQLTGSLKSFNLVENPMITDISSFAISQINEDMFISFNTSLSNLDPLISITDTVGRNVEITFNDALTSISGLQNISYMSDLLIVGNNSLTNLTGLEGISGHLESVVIPINDQLTDISALSNITNVNYLVLVDNPNLNDCCGIAQVLNNPNPPIISDISGNLADCASQNSILLSCGFPACNGEAVFNTQAELDAWITCDTLFGDLELNGADITDLSPLNGLKVVMGNVEIDGCTSLTSLNGLNDLTTIDKTLLILQANNLTNLMGLEQLTTVHENVEIVGNDNLISFQGLENLTGSITDLVIYNNEALTTVDVFTVNEVTADLIINDNDLLEDVDGLISISGNVERLSVEFNMSLNDLTGLNNIDVSDGLYFIGNDALTSLDGLESVSGSLEFLTIAINNQLINFAALSNITQVNDLTIAGNPQLNECCSVVQLILNGGVTGITTIEDNLTNCNSTSAIINACTNINGPADLELSIATTSSTILSIYEFYDFQITLTNHGEGIVNEATVDVPIPAGMAFSAFNTFVSGVYTYSSWSGKWKTLQPILPGASITLDFRLFSLTETVPVNLYAQVVSSDKPDPDSTPDNGACCTVNEDDEALLNLFPEGMILEEADLELTGTIDQIEVSNGDTISVTLTITNYGPDPASAVKIRFDDIFNDEVRLVFNSFEFNAGSISLTPFWFLGEILPGISYELTVRYAINDLTGPLALFFEVEEGLPNDPDSTPGNGSGVAASEDDEVAFVIQPAGQQDTDPPVPSLTTMMVNVMEAFVVNLNFNEPITDLQLADLALVNGTASDLLGSGNTYSFWVNPTAEGMVTISLPENGVIDAAGNGNVASNQLEVNYMAPSNSMGVDLDLSISADQAFVPIYTNVVYTITLSNTGITAANDIVVDLPFPEDLAYVANQANAGNFVVFARQWLLPTLAANSSVSMDLTLFTLVEDDVPLTFYGQVGAASPADDDSTPGNWTCIPNGVSGCLPIEDDEASLTINVDQAQGNPIVSLSTASNSVTSPFDVHINFSADVTDLEMADFSISNGNGTALVGTGSNYTLTIAPNNAGQMTIALPANRAFDSNNNGNLASNQLVINYVVASGNDTDLTLDFTATADGFGIYENITITLTVANTSSVDANNLTISYPEPENLAITSQVISAGTYSNYDGQWIIGNLAAGTSEVLEVTWFTLTETESIVAYAQVQTANPNDGDSTPGNGTCCTSAEDDEAVITIHPIGTTLRGEAASRVVEGVEGFKMLLPYPNPTSNRLQLPFYVPEARELSIQLVNLTGSIVHQQVLNLTEGYQEIRLDISEYPAGMYYLLADLEGKRRAIPIVKLKP